MSTASSGSLDERIQTWYQRRAGRQFKPETADQYTTWIRRFEGWLPTTAPTVGDAIDFDSWLSDPDTTEYPWEGGRGRPAPDVYAYQTRIMALSAVKSWLRYEYDYVVEDNVQDLVSGDPEPFEPKYLSRDDVAETIAEAHECGVDGCEAALRVTYDAILRASELVLLDESDFDFAENTVSVTATKGSLNATIEIDPATADAVEDAFARGEHDRAWANSYGNPWNARSWSKHFRTKHHEAGSHSFGRHTPIVHRLMGGESFGDVFRRARHKYPATTARYARYVGTDVPDYAGE